MYYHVCKKVDFISECTMLTFKFYPTNSLTIILHTLSNILYNIIYSVTDEGQDRSSGSVSSGAANKSTTEEAKGIIIMLGYSFYFIKLISFLNF